MNRSVLRVWQRNADVFLATWKVHLFVPLLEPLLYILAFGAGLGQLVRRIEYAGEPVSYVQFLAPALIATSVMHHGFFETTYSSFVRMYYQKTYDAILTTPVSFRDLMLGEVLWGATRSVVAAAVMLVTISLFGLADYPASLWIPLWGLAGGLCFSAFGLIFTAVVPSIDAFNFPYFLIVTPMFLFSGTFFPLDLLPAWARTVAMFSPLTHVVGPIRDASFGRVGADHLLHLGVLVLLTGAFLAVGLPLMKRRVID